MQMKTYRALQSFPYGKGRLAVGEQFEANEKIGSLLVKVGKASAEQLEIPAMVELKAPVRAAKSATPAEEEESGDPKPERTYQRRDMVAETPANPPPLKPRRGRPAGKGKRSQS